MPGTEDIYSDLRVVGKSIIYTVPNSPGTVLTYNTNTGEVTQRTAAQFISDLNLQSANTDYTNTGRNYEGILIRTDIDYSQSEGAAFLLEIKGNMYGGGLPLICSIQGYIYDNTIVNCRGVTTADYFTTILALNLGGKLCFYFPKFHYWQGFSAKVTNVTGGGPYASINQITSIDESPSDPGGIKRVNIPITVLINGLTDQTIRGLKTYKDRYWNTGSGWGNSSSTGDYSILFETLSGSNGTNQYTSKIGFFSASGVQAGIYVRSNDTDGTSMAFATTQSFAAGPQIGITLSNTGVVNFPRANPTVAGNVIWHAGNLNPASQADLLGKVNAWENAYAVGFSSGDSEEAPYIFHSINGYRFLGTQTWVNNNFIPKTHPVNSITQTNINDWISYGGYWDNRAIQPGHLPIRKFQFGFTAWDQNNNYPWADYIHFGGYQDSSGGLQNLIVFKKNGFGIRQFQGSFQGSATYGSHVDYWNTENLPNPANSHDFYSLFNGGISNQSALAVNGSQYASIGNTGNDFDGELSNKTIEGTFVNFNAYSDVVKNLAFTLFARTSTGHGIYYKTWYGGSEIAWRRLIDSNDIQNYVDFTTVQTINADKIYNQNLYVQNGISQYSLKVNQENNIWDFREYTHVGFSYWQGSASSTFGEGFGFHFYNEIYFHFGIDGLLRTKNYGNSAQWAAAYGWGNHAGAGYALANGSNASSTWEHAARAIVTNPYVPGRTFNASGAAYLQDATYGDVHGVLNSYGIAQGNPTDQWYHRIKMLHSNSNGYYTEIAIQMTGGNSMWYRRFENGSFNPSANNGWIRVWDTSNLPQTSFNAWNNAANLAHSHSNLFYLNNIDQFLGIGQGAQFNNVLLMDSLSYGRLMFGEDLIGGESGVVDITNDRAVAARVNEYTKYGSGIYDFEGINIHFNSRLIGINKEITNDEDKIQLKGNISVEAIGVDNGIHDLILNPLYTEDGDVRGSRHAHIYITTRSTVRLPQKPIYGQRIEIFNWSDSVIEVMHDNIGILFYVPGFGKVTGIVNLKGFQFDEEPRPAKQYDI